MNGRIQELAEQAELEVNAVFVWWPEGPEREDVVKEKFAELIVKECAEVAHCNFHVDGLTLGGIMKQHFGVE